jgi:hypothetical protein
MFQGWRLRLREAEQALQHGQLDAAHGQLLHSDLQQFLPGKRLGSRVAEALAERARQHAVQGDMSAAWKDMDAARELVGVTDPLLAARQDIVAIGLREAESLLGAGEAARAITVLEALERHDVRDESVRTFKQVARHLQSARNLARHGKLAEADAQVAAALQLHPDLPGGQSLRDEYREKLNQFRSMAESLHRALAEQDWTATARLADQLLELAPECRLARDARRRAWQQVGARAGDSSPRPASHSWQQAAAGPQTGSAGVALAAPPAGRRFLLWIDGVGGYLVCLAEQVTLGQAMPGNEVDVPILGDLSRQQARIIRRGDGYVLEPLQRTCINGQPVQAVTLLSDGDEIELADSVRLQFRQPHALSASARLVFVSRHRTQPTADGVLLMAESCVLGPGLRNHVVCRDWQGDVVLYQRDEALYCRAMDSIEIDGQLCDGKGPIGLNSRVVGDDFSLSLEELS